MRSLWSIVKSAALLLAAAQQTTAGPEDIFRRAKVLERRNPQTGFTNPVLAKRAAQFLTDKTKKFAVNGTGIPDVPFDIGESYAGLLPVSQNKNETKELFFWFFPSTNTAAKNEIAIWFNGGPGCSSLSGLLTENGPFTWEAGTIAPTQNPYTWVNLTNMLWMEQPVGVGFTQGKPTITNEYELGKQFIGFYKNFVDTFNLHKYKVYLTGESYAGYYVPYIANAYLEANDTDYYNLKGIAINDPIIGDGTVQQQVVIKPYLDYWQNLAYLNQTFRSQFADLHKSCGYEDYYNKYLAFPPPKGPFPVPVDPYSTKTQRCATFDVAYEALLDQNPCFNIYHITDTCPHLWSVMGIVNTGDYSPPGEVVYFNRTDVQKAINAPVGTHWYQCTPNNVFAGDGNDHSDGPAQNGVLQKVIERTNNVIIGSGNLDMLLSTNGTLLAIQNMTWNGKQGLQNYPGKEFFVPFHPEYNGGALSGAGDVGYWGAERGLTFYQVQLSGHELPGYAPGAGYRSIELLLGRIKDLSQMGSFTTQTGARTGGAAMFKSRFQSAKDIIL